MCETMERTNSHDSGSSDGSGSLNTSMDKEATQAVQVALNVRPLITQERIQGCKDCILVVPGEPQVCLIVRFLFLSPSPLLVNPPGYCNCSYNWIAC